MTTDAPRTPDVKAIAADLEIVGARLHNARNQTRLLRSELRELIGEIHRLTIAIDQLPERNQP